MSEEKTKYCPYCGVQIEEKYLICPNCGKQQPLIYDVKGPQVSSRKNLMLAVFLSLLITGAGQIYLGRVGRGLSFLGLVLLLSILLEGYLTFDELMIVGIVMSIISAWDAFRLGKEINQS